MSMSATREEELKNSLSDSNSRTLLAIAPADSGMWSSRADMRCCMMRLPMSTSALRPATSTK